MDGPSVTVLLADLLFNPEQITPERCASVDAQALAASAEHHQVLPLVLAAMRRRGCDADAMHSRVRAWTLHEALERAAVAEVLDRAAGIRTLFFKGAALAFSLYGDPRERMRVDWDLLVEENGFDALERALLACGFQKDLKTPRGLRNRQQSYRRAVSTGECAIDVHTGVFNAPALADRIRFEDLFARSVALPSLHPAARGAGHADALILACLHRLAHHSDEERLIWDYDIRLLVARADAATVLARAGEWRVGPLVAAEITRVWSRVPAAVPAWVASLAAQPSDVLSLARVNRSRGDDFFIDWQALGWRGRAALVRETLFPDPAYMRLSAASPLPLPVLYLRRMARGAAAWIRRPRGTDRPA